MDLYTLNHEQRRKENRIESVTSPQDHAKELMKMQMSTMTTIDSSDERLPPWNPRARMIAIATSAASIWTPASRRRGLRPNRSTAK